MKLKKTRIKLSEYLKPVERLTPSQWLEKNVYLPLVVSQSRPGKLRLAPWFKQILDDLDNPKLDTVSVCSSTRQGKTLFEILALLHALIKSDIPSMLILPTEKQAQEILQERIVPIIEASPKLSKIIKVNRKTKSENRIRGVNSYIQLGWAGSASALASIDAKLVCCDEVAKYRSSVGDESSAIQLAKARISNYRNSGGKCLFVSTPVLDDDGFYTEFKGGIVHHWGFSCPHCGKQTLPSFPRLKWEKDCAIKRLEDLGKVWYQCEHCEQTISEREYRRLVRTGNWQINDEEAEGKSGKAKSYWIPGLLSESLSFGYLVQSFLTKKVNPDQLQGFLNSDCGEPWTSNQIEIKEDVFTQVKTEFPSLEVPKETMELVAGLDVGGDGGLELEEGNETKALHFWFTVLACLPASKYQVIATGRFLGWSATMEFLTQPFHDADGKTYRIPQAFVDSGYKTDLIYGLALKNPGGVYPCDGMRKGEPVKFVNTDSAYTGWGRKKYVGGMVNKANINVNFFKDKFWNMVTNRQISFNTDLHPETFKHLIAEKKKKSGNIWTYINKTGAPNHILDCTVYALANSYSRGHAQINNFDEWKMLHPEYMSPPQTTQAEGGYTENSSSIISPW